MHIVLKMHSLGKTGPDLPDPTAEAWRPTHEMGCPLRLGAMMSDARDVLDLTTGLNLNAVCAPHFVLPFAADIARDFGGFAALEIDGQTVVTDGDRLWSDLRPRDVLGAGPANIIVRMVQNAPSVSECSTCNRCDPERAALKGLLEFAHANYAPATEESRARGAG